MRKGIVALALGALITLWATPASAVLGLVETSTKAKGATTITWESSFADFKYAEGTPITMTVNWTVDAGAAAFDSFALKHFTPKSKKDPADGTVLSICGPTSATVVCKSNDTTCIPCSTPPEGQVIVDFAFAELHLDKERDCAIGNAHFKLFLWVDKDGNGTTDSLAGFGVNVHVEDPQTSTTVCSPAVLE